VTLPSVLEDDPANAWEAAPPLAALDDLGQVTDLGVSVLFEHAPVGLAQIGPDGRFLEVNRRLCELLGYSRSELLALRVHDITHPDDLPKTVAVAQRLLADLTARCGTEERCLRKDGTLIWVKLTAGMARADTGAPVWGVAVVEDIPAPVRALADAAHIAYAGITVDIERLNASWDDADLWLSPKEVLLLCYLIRHQGEVASRERLLHALWGGDFDASSRTLDAHVCRLRRKVPPLAELLLTIGRVGYALRPDPAHSPA